jgi:hypothetical protein
MIYHPEDRCRYCAEPPGEYNRSWATMLRPEPMLPPRLITDERNRAVGEKVFGNITSAWGEGKEIALTRGVLKRKVWWYDLRLCYSMESLGVSVTPCMRSPSMISIVAVYPSSDRHELRHCATLADPLLSYMKTTKQRLEKLIQLQKNQIGARKARNHGMRRGPTSIFPLQAAI